MIKSPTTSTQENVLREHQEKQAEKSNPTVNLVAMLDEIVNDPDRLEKYMNAIGLISNAVTAYKDKQHQPVGVPDTPPFSDNQSVLRSSSVRRKDNEALRDTSRDYNPDRQKK